LGRVSGTPTYPPGWWIKTDLLQEDLVLTPDSDDLSAPVRPNGRVPFGQYSCGYVIVTDSAGNSFHRFHDASGLPESFKRDLFGEMLLFAVSHLSLSFVALLAIVLTLLLLLLVALFSKKSTVRSLKSD
jgi:hypothetical protein